MIRAFVAACAVLAAYGADARGTVKDTSQDYRVAGYSCDDIRAGIVLLGGYAAALAYLESRKEKLDGRKLAEVRRRCQIDR